MAATAERVLTRRVLNRAVLARQMLLARETTSIAAALEQMGGLQAQYAPSMYVGLWSRLTGFERPHLTEALERRTVVQGTLLRSTIHLVSARDYWPMALAVRAARRQWWLRVRPEPERELAAAADRLREHLRGGRTATRAEVEQVAGKGLALGVGLWVELVRVPPSGTWDRRRADLFAAAEDWLGPPTVRWDEAVPHVVRRYLQAFGPAPRQDVAGWAGLPVRTVTAALADLPTRRFRDEDGRELVDLPGAALPERDTPAPVRFLPTFDATLLAHARRSGVLAEEHRPRVFHTRMPQSVPTFLVDGSVAGTWRYADRAVRLEPFAPLGAGTRRELEREAAGLAALHA